MKDEKNNRRTEGDQEEKGGVGEGRSRKKNDTLCMKKP